jgi:peroxiredoxin Q/BCP
MSLDVGDPIPDFSIPVDGGGTLSRRDVAGRKLVIYFYPKDDTSACTKEAQAFRDLLPQFTAAGAVVFGVSKDSVASHDRFKAKHGLTFPLGSDESGDLSETFGVWVEKSMYGKRYMGLERSTFLIDGDGVVRHAWRKVKVPGHAEEVLNTVQSL